MELTREEVKKVGLLARLELDDEEMDRQAAHLNDLLAQFEKLQELDLTDVEPMAHSVPVFNVFREDVVIPSLPRDEVLANAPDSRDGFFIVPRIIEG